MAFALALTLVGSLGTGTGVAAADQTQLDGFVYQQVGNDGVIQEGRIGNFGTFRAFALNGRLNWDFRIDQGIADALGNPTVTQVSYLSIYNRSTQWTDNHFDERLNYMFHSSVKNFRYMSGWGPLAADHTLKPGAPVDIWFQANFWTNQGAFGVVSYHARILYVG